MARVLFIRAEWLEDIATKYLATYSTLLVNRAIELGYQVTDLYADQATLANFEREIPSSDVFMGFSHANESVLTGQKMDAHIEIILKDTVNPDALSGKKAFIGGCSAGVKLGPAIVESTSPEFYGYQCLSEDTRILTNNGWKGIDDISKEDLALTLNLVKGTLEFAEINEVVRDNYTGDMYHFANKRTDQLVTSNHRVLFIPQQSKEIKVNDANKIYTTHQSNNLRLPVSGYYLAQDYPIEDDALCLWAWILSEGTIRHNRGVAAKWRGRVTNDADKRLTRNGQDRIVIGQSLKHVSEIQRIRQVLSANKITWTERDYKSPWSPIPVRRFIFYKNGYSKTMPLWFLKLSSKQAKLFLHEYRRGDGSKRNFTLFTAKTSDVDILTALAIIAGWLFSVKVRPNGIYNVSIIRDTKDKSWVKPRKVNYSGRVWCINTNNKTIVCSRNGKIAITGNSDWTFIYHSDFYRNNQILEDPWAKAFFDCLLVTGHAILLGKSPLEVYEETLKRYDYWWDFWIKQNDPMADDILTWLNWDKRGFIAITPDGIYSKPKASLSIGNVALPLGIAAISLLLLSKNVNNDLEHK